MHTWLLRRLTSVICGASLLSPLVLDVHPVASRAEGHNYCPNTKRDTITVYDHSLSELLNPLTPFSSPLNYLLFAQLTAIDERGRLVPDLLAQLPSLANHQISRDQRTIRLQLKRHQFWSSGVEITSADIVFGWRVLKDRQSSQLCDGPYRCRYIDSIQLAGRYTAILHLEHPYGPVLACCLPPVLPHTWERLGTTPQAAALHLAQGSIFTYRDASYWTSGPYQIQRFDDAAGQVVLTPMKRYGAHPGHRIGTLIYSLKYRTPEAFVAAAASGQTDVTVDSGGEYLSALLARQHAYSILASPSFDVTTLQFNVGDATYKGHPNPAHDERVRQALVLALDHVAFTEEALGVGAGMARRLVGRQTTQMDVSREVTGTWDPIVKRYAPYGPEAIRDARLLLRQAGYRHGLTLSLVMSTGPHGSVPGFSVLQKDWQLIGVQTDLTKYYPTLPCHEGLVRGGQFEAYLGEVVGNADPNDLRYYLESTFASRPLRPSMPQCPNNVSAVRDRQMDEAFRKGSGTFASAERKRWYRLVETQVAKRAYWAPLYYVPNVVTYDRHVRGVAASPLPQGLGFEVYPQFAEYAWTAYRWQYVP